MTDKKIPVISAKEISELTGLSEDSVNLLIYWQKEKAISYSLDFINELIMKMPEFVFSKYRSLCEARASGSEKNAADISANICENIEHFLTYDKEVSTSESKNYAAARKILPCSREQIKKIKSQLEKERS